MSHGYSLTGYGVTFGIITLNPFFDRSTMVKVHYGSFCLHNILWSGVVGSSITCPLSLSTIKESSMFNCGTSNGTPSQSCRGVVRSLEIFTLPLLLYLVEHYRPSGTAHTFLRYSLITDILQDTENSSVFHPTVLQHRTGLYQL